jgi:DNA repair protein RadD
MSWIDEISSRLARNLGSIGVERLFSTSVSSYLKKHHFNAATDPYLIASVYLDVAGYTVFEKREFRKSLIDGLSDEQVDHLIQKLDLDCSSNDDVRGKVVEINWDWNSNKVREFCDYFNCDDVVQEALSNISMAGEANPIIDHVDGPHSRFFELHPYQSQIRFDVIKHITGGNQQKALIQLPTGAGKTRVAVHTIIKYLNEHSGDRRHILWLAYQPLLLKQALETFGKIWNTLGSGNISVGQYYGSINTSYFSSEQSITFANVSVLLNRFESLKEDIKNNVCVVVFDEAHQSIADDAKRLLGKILSIEDIKLIGLTATPGRSAIDQGENKRLVEFFDNHKFEIKSPEEPLYVGSDSMRDSVVKKQMSAVKYLQEMGVLANLRHEVIGNCSKSWATATLGDEFYTDAVTKNISESIERNYAIIEKAIELNSESMKTVIFACSVSHARDLVLILRLRNVSAGLVVGENVEGRGETIRKFVETSELNILVNYGVLTTGFDAPNIDALIIARPTSSIVTYSQILGRALRGPMNGGHDTNYIYNVDNPYFGDEIDAYNHFDEYWS